MANVRNMNAPDVGKSSLRRCARRVIAPVALQWLAVGLGASGGLAAAPNPATWRAGVASADITPEASMYLAGFGARTKPSDGVEQKLYAKALALADAAEGRFVFVTLDLIGVERTLRQAIGVRLAAAHGLRPEQFVLAASHTHCGPELREFKLPAGAAGSAEAARLPGYTAGLEAKIEALVGEALANLAPARLGYTRARAGFAMNRRRPNKNGGYTNAPHPEGPVDHDVPVLRVDGADGRLRAVLFGYACHNTTLSFQHICGDYAGYAQECLQADHPGVLALYMNGCAGDQNPYPRGTVALARAHGRTLATAVDAALGAAATPLTGGLQSALVEVDLRYAPPPARAEFEARLKAKDKVEAGHARRMLDRLARDGALPASYPYPVQVVQLGRELKFVALGGEAVVDYSLRLKRELGGAGTVWVTAYANDVMGYIPSERVLREGGYEGGEQMRGTNHPGPWASGLEAAIVGQVRELAAKVGDAR